MEAPSTAGSALARFGPIVAKNVVNLLAMIDVSDTQLNKLETPHYFNTFILYLL